MSVEAGHAGLDALGVVWRLGATIFFVFVNGFFVAAEFALVKVRSAQVDALARKGARSARTVQHILGHLDRYLSACQLGITLASLILGALGEPAVSVLIGAAVRQFGGDVAADARWLPFVSIGIAFAVITSLHMTIGEQAPKMWALRRAEATALATAPVLRAFAWLFGPFIAAINGASNAILRLLGLPVAGAHDDTHTTEEIRSILSLSARAGHISEAELELTENVFRMVQLEVRHIVVPRADIEFLSLSRPDEENLQRIQTSGHTRLPLCDVGLDTIVGFVHTKDVLANVLSGRPIQLRELAREALFVPDTMSVSAFLRELQAKQAQCAAVLDERGTVIGFAFREDTLEEIVGPLGDEFDELHREFSQISDDLFEVVGRMSLPEICDRLSIELPANEQEDEDTIGGHITARLGRLPVQGDVVSVGSYQATVLQVGRRRIERLRLERQADEPVDREPEEAATKA